MSNKTQAKKPIILPPFAAACAVIEKFLPAVKIGWKGHAIHQGAAIACLADTLMNAMKTVSGVTSVDVNKFNVSSGVLDSFNEESWSRTSANTIMLFGILLNSFQIPLLLIKYISVPVIKQWM